MLCAGVCQTGLRNRMEPMFQDRMKTLLFITAILLSVLSGNGQNGTLEQFMHQYNAHKERCEAKVRRKLEKAVKAKYVKHYEYYTKYWQYNTKDSLATVLKEARFVYVPLYCLYLENEQDLCDLTVPEIVCKSKFKGRYPYSIAYMIYKNRIIGRYGCGDDFCNDVYVDPPRCETTEDLLDSETYSPDFVFDVLFNVKYSNHKLINAFDNTTWFVKNDKVMIYEASNRKVYEAQKFIDLICEIGWDRYFRME